MPKSPDRPINYSLCNNPHCREMQQCAGLHAVEELTDDNPWKSQFLDLYRADNCQELDLVTERYNVRFPQLPPPEGE